MTAIDRLGFELAVTVEGGARAARVPFPAPIAEVGRAREVLVAMVRAARARLAAP